MNRRRPKTSYEQLNEDLMWGISYMVLIFGIILAIPALLLFLLLASYMVETVWGVLSVAAIVLGVGYWTYDKIKNG